MTIRRDDAPVPAEVDGADDWDDPAGSGEWPPELGQRSRAEQARPWAAGPGRAAAGSVSLGPSSERSEARFDRGVLAPPPAPASSPADPEDPRFAEGDALGQGSGGRVVRGLDRHLERDVALKIVGPGNPQALARLRREAAILVALEHPGIVPLYDLVERPDGGLQLALRIVRGRSLEGLLAGAAPARIPERLRWLARAAEAVAWAHHEGFVHRDLKPANIMVGEFGEVQVIDWGLAVHLGEPASGLPADTEEGSAYGPGITRAGAVLGTPRYMSPEQARGERVDTRADVWSLGAILFELVAGRPLFDGDDVAQVLAAVREGQAPRLDRAAPWAPPELVAVAARAMHPEPEQRYADARALADDLNAWLDGRPVAAHRYRLRQRVARFVKRRRLGLALVGGGLATLVAFVAAPRGGPTIVEDGARAEALAGQVAAGERHLARSLAREAEELYHQRKLPEAALTAARSMALAPTPEARGMLALIRGSQPARLAGETALALTGCASRALHRDGERWLCRTSDAVVMSRGAEVAWRHAGTNDGAELVLGGREVVVLTPERRVLTLDGASGQLAARSEPQDCGARLMPGAGAELAFLQGRQCLVLLDGARAWWVYDGPDFQQAAVRRDGRWALITMDGMLVTGVRDEHAPPTRGPEPRAFGVASRAATELGAAAIDVSAMLAFDDEVVLATLRGAVLRVGHDGVTRRRQVLGHDVPITALEASPSGDTLVARRDRGGAMIVDRESLQVRAVLPEVDAGATWLPDDASAITLSGRYARWELGERRLGALQGLHGLVTLALGDEVLAAAHDHWLTLFDARHGGVVAQLEAPDIIKSVAVRPDGHEAAYSPLGAREIHRFDLGPGALAGWPGRVMSRLGYTADGTLVALPYLPELWLAPQGGDVVVVAGDRGVDLAIHGARAAVLTRRSEALLLDLGSGPVELARCPVPGAVAASLMPDEAFLVVATGDAVWLVDAEDCALSRVLAAPGDDRAAALTDVQTSADGAWIAAATREGYVLVWRRDGELIAVVRAHAQRVSTLAFAPDGRRLFSAGWDGAIQVLDLETLDSPAAELGGWARASWGL